jgi:hypothetical protein
MSQMFYHSAAGTPPQSSFMVFVANCHFKKFFDKKVKIKHNPYFPPFQSDN